MHYSKSRAPPFYFNQSRDTLWFSEDVARDGDRMEELRQSYEDILLASRGSLLKIVMRPDDCVDDYLTLLGPLGAMLVVARDYDDNGYQLPIKVEEYQDYARYVQSVI